MFKGTVEYNVTRLRPILKLYEISNNNRVVIVVKIIAVIEISSYC